MKPKGPERYKESRWLQEISTESRHTFYTYKCNAVVWDHYQTILSLP